jgi:hypothetical protein
VVCADTLPDSWSEWRMKYMRATSSYGFFCPIMWAKLPPQSSFGSGAMKVSPLYFIR